MPGTVRAWRCRMGALAPHKAERLNCSTVGSTGHLPLHRKLEAAKKA